MADCVVCSYPMIHVANGRVVNMEVKADPKAREALEKHKIELDESNRSVGCYVCPECGHCEWLEQ
jgi:hypothetical protein